ncbi:hypothetical protein [Helicobacter rodentium]|uniref:hypothetical protein n=1 Tax=Helicobacter rodentium TaxID=59617 RepID=UPI002355BDAD|nr:hypothetical protein [Helicobacter rodentium]
MFFEVYFVLSELIHNFKFNIHNQEKLENGIPRGILHHRLLHFTCNNKNKPLRHLQIAIS